LLSAPRNGARNLLVVQAGRKLLSFLAEKDPPPPRWGALGFEFAGALWFCGPRVSGAACTSPRRNPAVRGRPFYFSQEKTPPPPGWGTLAFESEGGTMVLATARLSGAGSFPRSRNPAVPTPIYFWEKRPPAPR